MDKLQTLAEQGFKFEIIVYKEENKDPFTLFCKIHEIKNFSNRLWEIAKQAYPDAECFKKECQ